jgi:hypothetical protein
VTENQAENGETGAGVAAIQSDHSGTPCPECNGTRTLDGITDEASAAAWLDCTTCSAIPREEP